MSTPGLNRLSYIDTLKVIAAFMIVLLHVSAIYVDMTVQPVGKLVYYINALVRPGLFIFLMVSGALLLRPQYTFNFKKKFTYIAKIYAFWSAFYVVFDQLAFAISGKPLLTFPEMAVHWIRGPYHFWYLAMLLGMYIYMPILTRLKDFQTLNYFIGLGFVLLYVIPPARPFLPACVNDFITQMTIFNVGHILFFFILGAWLNLLPLDKSLLRFATFFFTLGLLLTLYQLHTAKSYDIVMAEGAIKSFSQLFLAAGIFYMIRYAYRNHSSSERMMLLSKCTLHIYVTSAFVIYLYQYLVQPHWDVLVPFPGASILFWGVMVFIGSTVIAYMVLLKDRWLKRYRTEKARKPSKAKK